MSRTKTGFTLFANTIVSRVASMDRMSSTPRTTAACGAEIQRVAADVLVVVVESLDHLRKGQPGVVQLVQVDHDLVGLALAAPTIVVDDAGHDLKRRSSCQSSIVRRSVTEYPGGPTTR
jgi:hypothetical protein